LLIEFFDDGTKWTKGQFHNAEGSRCLVGAMQHVRAVHRLSGDPTRHYLLAAMPRNWRFAGLMGYNDHCRESIELLIVLARAREMALYDAYGLPTTRPAAVETQQDSATARAIARYKEWMAATRKLLAEIERERIAAGRPTYILCPRVPESRPEPERLAA
jgi:hypothetical protein